uniref:Uncharacterized protein n=1 Tax=Pristionchus pacificus TaxID=54126 RepID=A0A8R1YYE7_PRIPA
MSPQVRVRLPALRQAERSKTRSVSRRQRRQPQSTRRPLKREHAAKAVHNPLQRLSSTRLCSCSRTPTSARARTSR